MLCSCLGVSHQCSYQGPSLPEEAKIISETMLVSAQLCHFGTGSSQPPALIQQSQAEEKAPKSNVVPWTKHSF